MVQLKGITWRHTRGYLPMVATAQRFSELNPNVSIEWQTRSLQQFADSPIQDLAQRFDLLVIDHPFCGYAAEHDVLLPLDEYLPASFLLDQASHPVGRSHESYGYGGHQWALAIDAATPVSGWRPDLLERAKAVVPATWPELIDLARAGLVAVSGIPIDSLMHFYMMCGALGEDPFQAEGAVVSPETGVRALQMLRQLFALCDPICLRRNPIATWQALSSGNTAAYCPFAYGYSNYSRRGYSEQTLKAGGLVAMEDGRALRSTLGGAGLAISSRCTERETAAQYAQFVAGAECQTNLYFTSGGQPGHRRAWLDEEVNRQSSGFFQDTLATLDAAYLRPRFNGYLQFQDEAAPVVHKYLTGEGEELSVLQDLDQLLNRSRSTARHGELKI
ncbi:MAG TPA: extracellular solute-binding protein [Acidobacteriaceae bacterium]|nr:extracellular solute-binding protein [Acidobacteriaceae bacterium]